MIMSINILTIIILFFELKFASFEYLKARIWTSFKDISFTAIRLNHTQFAFRGEDKRPSITSITKLKS